MFSCDGARAKLSEGIRRYQYEGAGFRIVLEQTPITSRRRSQLGAGRMRTTIPNLFAGDGRVHRLEATEREQIGCLFDAGSRASALICGDTESVLAGLPDGSFQSCVTSPPYWSLRDYGIPGQIGLEHSVLEYIEHLAKCFPKCAGF
jgi:hypothetical protein